MEYQMTGSVDEFDLPASARIGTVTLRVNSIKPLASFYEDVVGLVQVEGGRGTAAFATATDQEPLLVLEETPDSPPRPRDAAGLFHTAFRVPDRSALADALARIKDADYRLSGASDHDVSEALYLRDPEGNGVEIYYDRPRGGWPESADGQVEMGTRPLDLKELAAAGSELTPEHASKEIDIGHVHLEVSDLDQSGSFYRDVLGFRVRSKVPEALFLAAGNYHHHVGLNTWRHVTGPSKQGRGLVSFTLVVPDEQVVDSIQKQGEEFGITVDRHDHSIVVNDPDEITVIVRAADENDQS